MNADTLYKILSQRIELGISLQDSYPKDTLPTKHVVMDALLC